MFNMVDDFAEKLCCTTVALCVFQHPKARKGGAVDYNKYIWYRWNMFKADLLCRKNILSYSEVLWLVNYYSQYPFRGFWHSWIPVLALPRSLYQPFILP